jgi:hypothetical protein
MEYALSNPVYLWIVRALLILWKTADDNDQSEGTTTEYKTNKCIPDIFAKIPFPVMNL